VMRNHRVGPPRYGFVCVPVGEDGISGPYGSNVLAAVGVLQEHTTIIAVSVDAVVVAGIVGVGDVNGRVNNAEAMLALGLMYTSLLVAYGM